MKELDIPHSGILLMDAIFVSAKTVPQKRFTVFIREQMEAEPKRKEKEVRNWFTIQKLLFLRLKHRANQVEKKYAQSQDDRVAKNWLRFQLLNCCWNLEITFNLDEISSTSCFNFRCACRLRSIGIQRKGSWCITNSVLYAAIAWKTKIILFDFVMLAFLEDNRPNSWRMHTA